VGIDVPVKVLKEKNYMYGLMRRLAIFHYKGMGFALKAKDWDRTGKTQDTLVHFRRKD
jgi:hypothetical protein